MVSTTKFTEMKKNILNDFKQFVANNGGIRATSRLTGISPSMISKVCRGDFDVTPNIAKLVGWEKVITWQRIKK